MTPHSQDDDQTRSKLWRFPHWDLACLIVQLTAEVKGVAITRSKGIVAAEARIDDVGRRLDAGEATREEMLEALAKYRIAVLSEKARVERMARRSA